MSPKRLSHFELYEELGAGGMGVVYRAFDTQLQRTVAVKTLPWMGAADGLRTRFLTEARAASALSHPGIVTIHEVGTADGIDYIAMELVAGQTLADLLRGGPLAEGRIVGHACQLADALAAAHRAGIVHRDLKPANVVVTADDRLKILDFGLAKRLAPADPALLAQLATIADAERTADGTVLGTPAYMSPEQARGLPIDARTDLFALGCILYEELTGSRPFAGGDTLEILTALLRDTPEPPSRRRRGLSPRWDAILARLLARQPEERFASAEALLAELRLRFEPGRASPVGRQRPWMYAAGAGAALAVVALLALRARAPHAAASLPESEAPAFQFRLFSDFPGSHRQPTLSPDGATVAFVAVDAAGVAQIWVRSWAGGDPIQVTRGETNAYAPHWASEGDRIVFAREGAGIWEVPPLGGQPTRLVERGGYAALSPAGDRLVYVAGRHLVVAAGDGSDPRPVEALPPGFFGHTARASFSPDGAHLVAYWPRPDRPFGDLWRVDFATGGARKLTDLEFSPAGAPVWSGDGRSIVFASDHSGTTTLWQIPAVGGEPHPLTVGAGEDADPALSADGRRLVYTNTRNSWRLVRHDPTTGEVRVLSEQRRAFMLPHLSPDGRRVAYFARSPRAHHLYLLDIASGGIEQVTHGENVFNVHPRWSLDGASLVYYREAPVYELRRIRVDGQGDELLIAGWQWTRENSVLPSPDGHTLLYTRRDEGDAVETRLHDLATGASRPLPRRLVAASWTDDGSAVYGRSGTDETVELCRLDSDQCTEIGRGFYPRLSRNGRILYTLRSSPPRIWRRDLTSGREEDLGEIAGYELVYFSWSLAPDGTLIYPVKIPGREELWIGERGVAAPNR